MAMNRTQQSSRGLGAASQPQLLTTEEAAVLARCSIKTVRRAYASGALLAYRRRGSRAVLLDPQDVLSWVRGEVVQPVTQMTPGPTQRSASQPPPRARGARTVGFPGSDARPHFDLSPAALRERRAAKA